MDPSLSSHSSQRYEQLLTTVTSLQGDLQRTLGVCQALKAENQGLKKNFDSVKTELVRLREKYNAARRDQVAVTEAKMALEKEVDALMASWEAKLARKVMDYEELQKKFAPQDLNALKAQVKETLEVEFQQKSITYEGEIEKWRQMFYNVRREYEKIKTEYEQFSNDSGREMELLHSQSKAESNQLRSQLSALQTALQEANREDELRRAQGRAEAAELRCKQMENHLDELTREKAALELGASKDRVLQQQALAEFHTNRAGLEADRQALQRQVHFLEAEIIRHKSLEEEARQKNQESRDEFQRLRHQFEDQERALVEERQKFKEHMESIKKAWAEEKLELEQVIFQETKKANNAEAQVKEFEDLLSHQRSEMNSMEARLTKLAREKAAMLQSEIEKLQKDLLYMRDKVREAEEARQNAIHQALTDQSSLRAEVARLQREKEILQEKVSACQADIGQLQLEKNRAHSDLADESAQLRLTRENVREAEENYRKSQGLIEELNMRLKFDEEELKSQENQHVLLKNQYTKKLADFHAQMLRDRESILARAKNDIEQIKLKAKKSIKKEKKKSTVYKQKAIESHDLAKQYAQMISKQNAFEKRSDDVSPPV